MNEQLPILNYNVKERKFRCLYCNGISDYSYKCNLGEKVVDRIGLEEICGYQLYSSLGNTEKEVEIIIKDSGRTMLSFMPIDWEKKLLKEEVS